MAHSSGISATEARWQSQQAECLLGALLRTLERAAAAASHLPQPIEEHFAGIILGVCAAYLLDDGDDADSDTVLALAALVSDYIEEGWGEQSEGDIDQTVRRLVPSAFADAPQPAA